MLSRFRRPLLLASVLLALAGCSTRETKQALATASDLAAQQHYQEANNTLVEALKARETKIRAGATIEPTDAVAIAALTKKVQSDPEILKMERAQVPLYLHLERSDLAAAVYADIVAGNPGDHVLSDLLHDPDPKIRTRLVRTLGLVAKGDSIDPLIEATKDTDGDVRSEAVSSLGMVQDPRTVPPLIHALNDSYWFVRSEAADALQRERDPSAIPALLDTVSDPNADVGSAAEMALVFISAAKGASPAPFAPHLDDANAKVAMISAICLAVMKDPRATPWLLKKAASPDVAVRLPAVKGLGETGDPAAIPVLRQTLHDPEVNVRGWSIIGLDNLHDTGSIPALEAMAKDPKETDHIHEYAAKVAQHLSSQTAADDTPK
jgi:HEAT repeat protein